MKALARISALGFPQNSITDLKDVPRSEWGKRENHGYDFIRMLFPNFSFFLAPEMCQFGAIVPRPQGQPEHHRAELYLPDEARERGRAEDAR